MSSLNLPKKMDKRPIHQNLDTSFVNLSSLVKYLKKRHFAGSVSVRLNGYSAEILIKENNRLKVREHDLISGRISEGPEAFKRILIRSREPGGTIDVFQRLNKKENPSVEVKAVKKVPQSSIEEEIIVPVEIIESSKTESLKIPATNGTNGNGNKRIPKVRANGISVRTKDVEIEEEVPQRQSFLPDFPFELTNSVEKKALSNGISNEEWQMLLKLSVEIFGVVDRSLSNQNLDFAAAFRKARAEIADDYPFMNPSSGIFDYENGRMSMKERVNEGVFVQSLVEALKRIFERLGANPKFSILYRDTSHILISLMEKRKTYYDKFGITRPLKNMLGL